MNKWLFAAATATLGGILLIGCGDEPRKTVSDDDICAGYKSQLDALLKDTKMSEQDKINQLPFLSGYSLCKDKIGTGGLPEGTRPGTSGPPGGSGANQADANQRSQSASQGN